MSYLQALQNSVVSLVDIGYADGIGLNMKYLQSTKVRAKRKNQRPGRY